MKLKRVKIEHYKNLIDFEIIFTGSNITAILGQNGTGKSNLFEFIADIFIDIEQNEQSISNYEIEYAFVNNDGSFSEVVIKYSGEYEISINGKKNNKKTKNFPKKYEEYLPKFVFAYYSGLNNRLKARFDKAKRKFHKQFLKDDNAAMRRFLYSERKFSLFVLVIFLIMEDEQIKKLLKNTLNIESLEFVLFKLHRPYWAKEHDYFWGSKGFVSNFLKKLYMEALSPLKLDATKYVEREQGVPRKESQEFIYLYFDNIEKLRNLMRESDKDDTEERYMFKCLESMFISDLVEDIMIKTNTPDISNNSVEFKDLSEGEMQLFTVLGLLKFTNEKNSLFLLDEPDTHLNPTWSRDYVNNYLKDTIGTEGEKNIHVLITTHDPVLIGGMEKEDVIIMKKHEDGSIIATNPKVDPLGSGYAGILTSDIFNFISSLSTELERDIQKKTILLFKENRTQEDEKELKKLSQKLKNYDYEIPRNDPLYAEYIKAREVIFNELSDNSTEFKKKRNQDSIEAMKKILKLGE